MQRWNAWAGAIVAVAVAVAGCGATVQPGGSETPPSPETDTPDAALAMPSSSETDTADAGADAAATVMEPAGQSGGTLSGTMGTVQEVAGAATVQLDRSDPTVTSVRLDAQNTTAQWWMMTALGIVGGIDSLQDGQWYRSTPNTGDTELYTQGCSGPSYENWTYDDSAIETDIYLRPSTIPGMRRADFIVVFMDDGQGEQRVNGSFEYQP